MPLTEDDKLWITQQLDQMVTQIKESLERKPEGKGDDLDR